MIDDSELLGYLGSLTGGDSDDTYAEISGTLDKIDTLPDAKVAAMMCCKEGIARVKERFVVEDPELRCMLISRLGKTVIRAWMVINSEGFDIEGYVRVSSRTESRRMADDFMDMAIEIMKNCANGALGHAPAADSSQSLADNLKCCSAYCEVLTYLLDMYNIAFEPLNAWVDALLGLSGSGSLAVHLSSATATRSAALSLLPLLKPAMMVAFQDRYLLIQRCHKYPTYNFHALRLVSAFMRTMLTDLSSTASLLTLLESPAEDSGAGQSLFGSSAGADVSDSTVAGHLAVPLVQYVSEWVEGFLLPILVNEVTGGGAGGGGGGSGGSGVGSELVAVVRDVMCLTQHIALEALRRKTAVSVLQNLFYLFDHHSVLFPGHEVTQCELVAWSLLQLRYIAHLDETSAASGGAEDRSSGTSGKAPESVVFAYSLRVFKELCELDDSVAQLRLFAEFSVLLLHHAMEHDFVAIEVPNAEDWATHGTSRTGVRFTATLPSALLRCGYVRQLLDCGVRSAQAPVLARFATALCSTYHSLLRYALTPVVMLLPTLPASSASATAASTAAAADFLDFTPTIDPAVSAQVNLTAEERARLAAYLRGEEEGRHTWSLLRDDLGCARIRRLCTSIEAEKRQLADGKNSLGVDTMQVQKKLEQAGKELVSIVVHLVEGALFAVKTFEGCLKWPLGDVAATVSDIPTPGYYRSDSAQHALVDLLNLLTKLVSPAPNLGLFAPLQAGRAGAGSGAGSGGISTAQAAVLTALAPYTQPHIASISSLRGELSAVLRPLLEWITADAAKMQNARFVHTLLVCLITAFVPANDADALSTAELILVHLRNLLYQTHVYQEHVLTLQAKAMQGQLGGAHPQRFDGVGSALASQLLALDLLLMLLQQYVPSSSAAGSRMKITEGCLLLLRTVERDYIWSEALHVKTSLSDTTAVLDAHNSATFTTPNGVVIQKVPVSPVLKEAIAHTLRTAMALLPLPVPTSLRDAAAPLYSDAAVVAYLQSDEGGTVGASLLGLNGLSFGTAGELPTTKKSAFLTASTATTATTAGEVSLFDTTSASAGTGKQEVSDLAAGGSAWLKQLMAPVVDALCDDTDIHQGCGLFTGHNRHYSAAAVPERTYITHADLLGQVQDVLNFHLHAVHEPVRKSRLQQTLDWLQRGASATSSDIFGTAKAASSASNTALQLLPSEHAELLATALLPPRERFWTTVSGSGDLLTVQASSEVDLLTRTATIHVRVHNSAGFKIPTFALQLLVNGNAICVDHTANLPSPAELPGLSLSSANNVATSLATHATTLQRTAVGYTVPAPSVSLDGNCVIAQLGVDFFLPNAYIERSFTCRIESFAPFSATVRLVYADLDYDDDNIYEIPVDSSSGAGGGSGGAGNKSKNGQRRKKGKSPHGIAQKRPPYLDDYRTTHSSKWAAVLDCEPLIVPVSALLMPYGYGSFSGLRHFAQGHLIMHGDCHEEDLHTPGIPEAVYTSMWQRLGGRFEFALPVEGELHNVLTNATTTSTTAALHQSALVSVQLREAVRSAVMMGSGRGLHLLGMDAMVDFSSLRKDVFSLTPYLHYSVHPTPATGAGDSGDGVSYSTSTAWCLQTPWGGEICIRLVMDRPVSTVPAVPSSTTVTMFDALDSLAVGGGDSGGSGGDGAHAEALWSGRLVVRCSDAMVLQAAVCGAEDLVHALSGGYLWLSESV